MKPECKLDELEAIAKAGSMFIEKNDKGDAHLCIERLTSSQFHHLDIAFVTAAVRYMLPLIEIAKAAQAYQDKMDGASLPDLAHNWGDVYRKLEALHEQ